MQPLSEEERALDLQLLYLQSEESDKTDKESPEGSTYGETLCAIDDYCLGEGFWCPCSHTHADLPKTSLNELEHELFDPNDLLHVI